MGFNRRKLEDQRRDAAEKVAAIRRATDAQVLEDAERLIAAWNERQAKRMPILFSPTIGAAVKAGYWFVWVRCPVCRTINAIDLRGLDRHPDAAVTSLIPALSCRPAGLMHRLPSWCGSREPASPTKCARSIVGAY
jgi:beta-phosphoglucomutase-like phosphatase (HAD superfamily)